MSFTVSPVKGDLFTALRTFLLTVVPAGTEVIQGIENRVAMPVGPYVLMTLTYQQRLATNEDSYGDPYPTPGGTKSMDMSARVDIQLDCFGPDSLATATMLQTVLRDETGCTALAPTLQPLYTDDPRMIPLTTGEEQYLERWMLMGVFQYNPVTVTSQDFAGTLAVALIDVDETYPP